MSQSNPLSYRFFCWVSILSSPTGLLARHHLKPYSSTHLLLTNTNFKNSGKPALTRMPRSRTLNISWYNCSDKNKPWPTWWHQHEVTTRGWKRTQIHACPKVLFKVFLFCWFVSQGLTQPNVKFTMQQRLILNSGSSCLHLPNDGITSTWPTYPVSPRSTIPNTFLRVTSIHTHAFHAPQTCRFHLQCLAFVSSAIIQTGHFWQNTCPISISIN